MKLLLSVTELFAVAGSGTPLGDAMLAVFVTLIGGVPFTVPVTVKTTVVFG